MKKLPDAPGVYFFMGKSKEVLYVGKATSLRDRVRSYFASDLVKTRGQHMVNMVQQALRVDFRECDSVLEALILEAKLIKDLKPPYNTRDKDDKSFNHILITLGEEYPRLLTVRGKDVESKTKELEKETGRNKVLVYGPFPHAGQLTEALKIVRKIFPYYDTVRPVTNLREKADRKLRFNESIGVYPPPNTTKAEYAKTVRHIRLFFDGKKSKLLQTLERDMNAYAKKQEFEKAEQRKRQVFALQHINDVSLIRRAPQRAAVPSIRIEGYDVAHLSGKNMVGVMTVVEGGEVCKKEYRTFNIKSVEKSNDTAALRELLSRRLTHHEWEYPRLIVVDGGTAQLNVAKKLLQELGIEIPVIAVTKDEKHRPKKLLGLAKLRSMYMSEILLVNAEAHRFSIATHRKKRRLKK